MAERGVKVTWALSGWLLPEEAPAKEEPMDVDPSQGDSQPQSQAQVEDDAPQAKRRGIVLCTDDRLEGKYLRHNGLISVGSGARTVGLRCARGSHSAATPLNRPVSSLLGNANVWQNPHS
jgi:hypothetical protein